LPSSCPALPTPTPPSRRRRLPRPPRFPRPRRPPRPSRRAPSPPGGRVYRIALLGTVLALAIALVPDLDLKLPPPSLVRAGAQGSVRDVALDLSTGTPLGPATARAGRLEVPAGRAGSWLSASMPLDGARMVALSWDAPAPAAAAAGAHDGAPAATWVRTGGLIGWSDWEPVEVDDTGPDPGGGEGTVRGRGTSEGFWVGDDARAVQVRVDLDGRGRRAVLGLAAHLIDPGADPAAGVEGVDGMDGMQATDGLGEAGAGLGEEGLGAARPARGAVYATTVAPPVVRRRRWGANERLRRDHPRYAHGVRVAFLHHTANARHYSRRDSAAIVRATYLFHTRVRGYNDLGYNFMIDRFGRVFEGRAGGVSQAVVGAHTSGFNTGSFSVALIGHYGRDRVPPAMQTALRRLLAWKLSIYRLDPKGSAWMRSGGGAGNRYPKGKRVRLRTISMHRDVGHTSCPGVYVARLLPALRDAVARTRGGR